MARRPYKDVGLGKLAPEGFTKDGQLLNPDQWSYEKNRRGEILPIQGDKIPNEEYYRGGQENYNVVMKEGVDPLGNKITYPSYEWGGPDEGPLGGSQRGMYHASDDPLQDTKFETDKNYQSFNRMFGKAQDNYGVADPYRQAALDARNIGMEGYKGIGDEYAQQQAQARQMGMDSRGMELGARDMGLQSRDAYNQSIAELQNAPSVAEAQGLAQREALQKATRSQLASQQGGFNPANFRAAQASLTGTGQDMAAQIAASAAQEEMQRRQNVINAQGQGRQYDLGIRQADQGMRQADLGLRGAEREDYAAKVGATAQQGADRRANEQIAQNWQQIGLADRDAVVGQQMQKYGIDQGVGVAGGPSTTDRVITGVTSTVGSIIGAVAGSSDVRSKKDIHHADAAIEDFLDALSAYKYKYKGKYADEMGGGEHTGVMAQDLERSDMGRELVMEDGDGMKRVDYGRAMPMAIASLANLHKRIANLEGRQ